MFSVGRLLFGCIAVMAMICPTTARSQERLTSIALTGNLTTSSKLFYDPDSPDEVARAAFFPFSGVWGGGIDLRRAIPALRLTFGLSIEYIAAANQFTVPVNSEPLPLPSPPGTTVTVDAPVQDGYYVFPVELSAYFTVPISTERFQLYIGGGGGGYFGDRRYKFGTEQSVTTDRSAGYGIQVTTGSEYFPVPEFSVRMEVKFRDVQFRSTHHFLAATTIVDGTTVPLPAAPFPSRVNIDGMNLALHFAYNF